MPSFLVRLDNDDYDRNLRGWRCPMLDIAQLELRQVLGPDGAPLDLRTWEASRDLGTSLIRWKGDDKVPAKIRAQFEVLEAAPPPPSPPSPWTQILVPVLVAAVGAGGAGTAYFQYLGAKDEAKRTAEDAKQKQADAERAAVAAKDALASCEKRAAEAAAKCTGGSEVASSKNHSTTIVSNSRIDCPPCPPCR